MADGEAARLPGAADLLDSLTGRIHQLSAQLADARGELTAARKRVEVYETFDETVQGALTSALRAAYDIRTRAEQSAATLVTEASAERDRLRTEIATLERERQTLAAARSPGGAGAPAAAEDEHLADLRARAADALSGLIDTFVAEADGAVAARRPPAAGLPERAPAPEAAAAAAAGAAPGPFTPRLVSGSESAPPPAEAAIGAAAGERGSAARPTDELEIVVSQVPAFARLVELERRIQELPIVRTIYVRDYRDGVVRLAVGLRVPTTAGEFAALVARIARPRLTVMGSAGATLELRLEGEASVA
ncbi:MAG: hypothetical protein ACYC9W_05710 [Candidatus Limnocylindria bacterium]